MTEDSFRPRSTMDRKANCASTQQSLVALVTKVPCWLPGCRRKILCDLMAAANYRHSELTTRYNLGYTIDMKTAISIPDPIFQQAELVAEELSLSRSELYAKAVEAFISSRRQSDITAKLNEVYLEQRSTLDPVLLQLQTSSLSKESW